MRFILCFLIGFIIFILLNNIDTYIIEYPNNSIYTIFNSMGSQLDAWPTDTVLHSIDMMGAAPHLSKLGYHNTQTLKPEPRDETYYRQGCWKNKEWSEQSDDCVTFHIPHNQKNKSCLLEGWIQDKDGNHLPEVCNKDKIVRQSTFDDDTLQTNKFMPGDSYQPVKNTGFHSVLLWNNMVNANLPKKLSKVNLSQRYYFPYNHLDPSEILPIITTYDFRLRSVGSTNSYPWSWSNFQGVPDDPKDRPFPQVSVVITDFESVMDMYTYILYVKNNDPEFRDIPDPILITNPHAEKLPEGTIKSKSLYTEGAPGPGGGYVKVHKTTIDKPQFSTQHDVNQGGCSFTQDRLFRSVKSGKFQHVRIDPSHIDERSSDTLYVENPVIQSHERNWKDPKHDFLTSYDDDQFMTIMMRQSSRDPNSDGDHLTSYGIPHRYVIPNATNCQVDCSQQDIDDETILMYKFMRRLGLISVDGRTPNSENFVVLWGFFSLEDYTENYRYNSVGWRTFPKFQNNLIPRVPRVSLCTVLYDRINISIRRRYNFWWRKHIDEQRGDGVSPEELKIIVYCVSCTDRLNEDPNKYKIPYGIRILQKIRADMVLNELGWETGGMGVTAVVQVLNPLSGALSEAPRESSC